MTMTPFAKVLDAIPVVPTTAYRNTFYPSTTTINTRVQNLETGNIERWNGSAWVTDFYGAGGSSATGAIVLTGSASPAGAVVGNPGWLYVQQVSTTVTLLWVKQSGTATTTGWVAMQGVGTGLPEGVLTAGIGVPYVQQDAVNGKWLWVKGTASGNTGWRQQAVADGRANMQRVLAKLTKGVDNATIQLISDSTGTSTYWFPVWYAAFAALYPAYTVKVFTWSTGTNSYDAGTVIQTGTGSQTLSIYNCSISGANTATFLAPYFSTMIQVVQPDFCFISLGHNENLTASLWQPQYLELVTSVVQACPRTAFCVIAQNPEVANTGQEQRASVYAEIAADYGMGFIDICQLFNENGGAAALDKVDGVHPNPTGVALWAAEVLRCSYYSDVGLVAAGMNTWPSAADELLTNGDFSNYPVSPGAPIGWVIGGGATVTKDTTNFESPNGYAVKVQAVGAAPGYLEQVITSGRTAGNWVTVLTREYVAASSPTSCGEVGIYDGVGSSTTSRISFIQGAFRYVVWQQLIATTSTSVTILLYGDQSTTNGAATFDRVSARIGKVPLLGLKGGAVTFPQLQPGTAQSGSYKVGTDTGGFTDFGVNGAAGNARQISFRTASSPRWIAQATQTAETGSDAGSNYSLIALTDAGATIDTPISIIRAANGAAASARSWAMKGVGAQQSADRGDASVTLQHGVDQGEQIFNTPLTAGRTVALSLTSAANGATFDIRRTVNATGNFGIAVGGGPLVTLSVPGSWCRVGYNGSAWTLLFYGIDASVAPALTVASPSDPTGTTSTAAFVMMGLAGSITPVRSGRVQFTISGQMANGTAGDGVSVRLYTGTGTAPTNGAALTGTQRGNTQTVTSVSAAQRSGFSISVPVSGLTLGTAVWIDAAVEAVTGGTASIYGVTISAVEIP